MKTCSTKLRATAGNSATSDTLNRKLQWKTIIESGNLTPLLIKAESDVPSIIEILWEAWEGYLDTYVNAEVNKQARNILYRESEGITTTGMTLGGEEDDDRRYPKILVLLRPVPRWIPKKLLEEVAVVVAVALVVTQKLDMVDYQQHEGPNSRNGK